MTTYLICSPYGRAGKIFSGFEFISTFDSGPRRPKKRGKNCILFPKIRYKNIPAIPKYAGSCYLPAFYRSTAWPVLSPVSRGIPNYSASATQFFYPKK